MVFSSPIFLFAFMPIAVSACYIAKMTGRSGVRNALLLAFSLVFYAWGEPVYVLLMMFSILVNWLLGMRVRNSKAAFAAAIALDLGLLCAFKYLGFIISSVSGLTGLELPGVNIALPIGISFYTFQIISYIVDVRRGDAEPQKNLVSFGAYVSMFPQLIAGPIVRYRDVAARLERIDIDAGAAASGVRRFCFGLFKKVIIANSAAEIADAAFGYAGALAGWAAWLGVIAYAIQIYYDFSGYSDMAIGLGRLLGFDFMENFDRPYISTSVRGFWRRWHISLSTWFRDYLYIPMGGSRKGGARTLINLLTVFLLCGLWHGASWNFAAWGLWHGLFLCVERAPGVKKLLGWLPRYCSWIYTMLVVLVGWVIFRADSMPLALDYLKSMFAVEGGAFALEWRTGAPLILGVLLCVPLPKLRKNALTEALGSAGALALLAVSMIALAGGTYNPFIYFRF